MSHLTHHQFPTYAWADKNSYYLKRVNFLKKHGLPGLDEIKLSIGAPLADIFFSSATPELKKELGLDPILEGPRGPLWLSPSNVLKGKVVLTEPYPRRKIQATTHETILDIGKKLEEQYEHAFRQKLEQELKAKEDEMNKCIAEAVQLAVKNKKKEMQELYRARLKCMREELITELKVHIEERDRYLCSLAEEKVRDSLEVLRSSMAEEMEIAAQRKKRLGDEETLFTRNWDKNICNEVFKERMNNFKKKWTEILKKIIVKCDNERKEMEHNLELKHQSEFEILEKELSEKYKETLDETMQGYRATIEQLQQDLESMKNNYEVLKKEKECMDVQQYSWCFLVKELLRQFQKFISYALKEEPSMTEHLTSLEKLLGARLSTTQEYDFLKEYVLDTKVMDAKEKLDEEIKVVNKAVKEESTRIPCIPYDDVIHFPQYQEKKRKKEMMNDIAGIIDQLMSLVIPVPSPDLPCIPSSFLSTLDEEYQKPVWPELSSEGDFRVLGDSISCYNSISDVENIRVKAIMTTLNKYPGLKRALICS